MKDVVGRNNGLKAEQFIFDGIDIGEIIEMFHAGSMRKRDFNCRGKKPGGDVDVIEDDLHDL